MIAAEKGMGRNLNILIKAGAGRCNHYFILLDVTVRDSRGKTALHQAVQPNIAMKLIETDKSLLSIKDSQGNTPLHLAFKVTYYITCSLINKRNCPVELLTLMIEQGASLTTKNKEGLTPLDVGHPNLVDYYNKNLKPQ